MEVAPFYAFEQIALAIVAALLALVASRIYQKKDLDLRPYRIHLKELLVLMALLAVQLALQEVIKPSFAAWMLD